MCLACGLNLHSLSGLTLLGGVCHSWNVAPGPESCVHARLCVCLCMCVCVCTEFMLSSIPSEAGPVLTAVHIFNLELALEIRFSWSAVGVGGSASGDSVGK